MAFKKGEGGRAKGQLNKTTTFFKEAVIKAFEDIGGTAALSTWAKANQTEFYKIAARLIPTEVTATINDTRSASEYSDDELLALLPRGDRGDRPKAQEGKKLTH